ncbi:MAG: glycosyltransferase family 9 protein [Nitrospirae bacterium]|nr:glycosyltransferase family 9 protein [Nitrospirota bacterium]
MRAAAAGERESAPVAEPGRLNTSKFPPLDPQTVREIVIVNLGGMGDVLLSTPVLRSMRNHFRKAHITFVAHSRGAQVVQGLGVADEILSVPVSRPRAWLAVVWRLRHRRPGLAVNMRTLATARGALFIRSLFAALRARLRAGRNTDGLGEFFNISVPETYVAERADLAYDEDLARALGVTIDEAPPEIAVTPADRHEAGVLLGPIRTSEIPVVVGLGSGWESRRWPTDRFARVLTRLRESLPIRPVLVGGPAEHGLGARLVELAPALSPIDLIGRTSLGVLWEVLKNAALVLANDSGPMHMAVAVGTPGVFLFGPGQVTRYGPQRNREHYRVMHTPVPCAPCEHRVCPNPGDENLICLKRVEEERVYQACVELLSQRRSTPAER